MSTIIVHVGRKTTLEVDLGFNITGETITSEIRTEPNLTSPLIATWTVTVDDATNGLLTLTLEDTITEQISVASGYMDIRRVDGSGDALPVFDKPLEVEFRGTVTGDGT